MFDAVLCEACRNIGYHKFTYTLNPVSDRIKLSYWKIYDAILQSFKCRQNTEIPN